MYANNAMLTIASNNALLQDERKLKFIKKTMHMAQSVAKDNDSCYSRHIGCVIMDNKYHVLGMGYNGPPARTPHCDTYDYLTNFFIPQLTSKERETCGIGENSTYLVSEEEWAKQNHSCATCPRRLIQAGPGERSTLCSCQHAERNAITNVTGDLEDAMIMCWCGVPCIDCAGAIINSGIREVHCLYVDGPDYHPVSRYLLQTGGVELFIYKEEFFS